MKKSVIILGTATGVGKSTVALALCRHLHKSGISVAPFKAVNIARHGYYIPREDKLIGFSQAMQAEASGVTPTGIMNPVFLKTDPKGNARLYLNGKAQGEIKPGSDYTDPIRESVCAAYDALSQRHEMIVIEGSGSCCEINLKDRDVSNLFMASYADADIILVADIDRGGMFASVVGTLGLMDSMSRGRVKGVVINRFRGDISELEGAMEHLTFITGVPVIGVIPYFETGLLTEESNSGCSMSATSGVLDIAAIRVPNRSSDNDIMPLMVAPGMGVRPVSMPSELGSPDLIFMPGSYNSMDDNAYLQSSGLDKAIRAAHSKGSAVFGICGGLQMMGKRLLDPELIESDIPSANGVGLMDYETEFRQEVIARHSHGEAVMNGDRFDVDGYEHHCGHTGMDGITIFTTYEGEGPTGAAQPDKRLYATYVHGIFENTPFAQSFVDMLLTNKGLEAGTIQVPSYHDYKQGRYDAICQQVIGSLRLDILGL